MLRTIPGFLTDRAERNPDAVALLAPGRPGLTYARLYETILSAGSHLAGMGIRRGDRVAIVLPNGPEMAAAFLAVGSCAVAAPLNPAYGANEFEFYLADLDARTLIVQAASDSPAVGIAAARGIPILELNPGPDAAAGCFTLSPGPPGNGAAPSPAAAEDVALVLHTSGTTSRPKMVPLTQENLCLSAQAIAQWFSLVSSDRCLNIMPLFHIHGLVGAVLSSLSAGANVVCTPGFDVTRWFEWMAQFSPTWYTAVPTMHQAILGCVGQHGEILKNSRLRFIRSCSSALSPKLMEDLEAAFAAPVLESYGMTEASHQIAGNPLPPGIHKAGSVGLAAGPEVAIMDKDCNLLPRGQTGEIVLRGPTITRGYEANPEANRKAFAEGWFRTGDEGHIDNEGYIFISARIKEIINRGGEKISPREIDEALLQHPAVSQAVAFSLPHVQLGEDVGAAVVLKAGAAASEAELRRFAAARLAYFKVPRLIRILDEIPKGATGKIQRVGMTERLGLRPVDDAAIPRAEYRPPSTPLQRELARIWGEVLGMKDIGVEDSFFALGGNSILATTLMVRLARELGARMSLVDFMDAPTIAGIAETIEHSQCEGPTDGGSQLLVAVQPRGTLPPLFCFPGRDGTVLGFWNLARRLGSEQPLIAFAANKAGGSNEAVPIEKMASDCIRLIRGRQAAGPYFLLGNCFGGLVALEIARRLSREGDEVALLAMLDCFNHEWRRDLSLASLWAHKARHAVARSRLHLANFGRLSGKGRLVYLKDRVSRFMQEARIRALQHVYDTCVRRKKPIPRMTSDICYANRWAERTYRRQPYSGAADLFRTTDPAGGIYPAPLMGWKGLLQGKVTVFDVPGEHLEMLSEPAIEKVAQVLRERLSASDRP